MNPVGHSTGGLNYRGVYSILGVWRHLFLLPGLSVWALGTHCSLNRSRLRIDLLIMSAYEDEVDYTEDPLAGVDIWGNNPHAVEEEMDDMAPVQAISAPTLPTPSDVAGGSSPIGEFDQFCFATPSLSNHCLWDFSQT